MRVLVCGGRGYGVMPDWYPPDQSHALREKAAKEAFLLRETLDDFHKTIGPFTCLVHGAAKGADSLACRWALKKGLLINSWMANWKLHGKAAGPIRNQQMIDDGKPELVIAFPGGNGTADMTRRAHAAGIRVIEVAQ
jgi:hypothetical protein